MVMQPQAVLPPPGSKPPWVCASAGSPLTDLCFALPDPPARRTKAKNATAITHYNYGLLDSQDVNRKTSAAINRLRGRWADVVACVLEYSRARDPFTGAMLQPDHRVFNAAILACGHAYRHHEAIHLFNAMLKCGVMPSTATYNHAINSCAAARAPDDAFGLLRHMQAHGAPQGVFPNIRTYNAVIMAAGLASRPELVMTAYHDLMQQCQAGRLEMDVPLYTALITAFFRCHCPEQGLAVFNQLCNTGRFPCLYPSIAAYNALIEGLVRNGCRREAHRAFAHLEENGPVFDTFADADTLASLLEICNDEKAADLLDNALKRRVVRPAMGFDAATNTLDLHAAVVYERSLPTGKPSPVVSKGVARAIFRRLAADGTINGDTRIVTGLPPASVLQPMMKRCLAQQGWAADNISATGQEVTIAPPEPLPLPLPLPLQEA